MFGLHAITYRCTDGTRFGVGPVGDSWRETIGVSFGLFGRGFAVFHVPKGQRWSLGSRNGR
ncbi:hypothetical protein [Streptomyces sp. IBSNAI001]|uniref:hypothetical protein n=1 Tax=Streptomyces sp. IBSNAI001 TaxID=3457499 RepID=UPI003FD34348